MVEARSQPVAMRRRCMGGEETLANLAFLESDDLRIQNLFFEFASMGDRLRTAVCCTQFQKVEAHCCMLAAQATQKTKKVTRSRGNRGQRAKSSNAAEADSYR